MLGSCLIGTYSLGVTSKIWPLQEPRSEFCEIRVGFCFRGARHDPAENSSTSRLRTPYTTFFLPPVYGVHTLITGGRGWRNKRCVVGSFFFSLWCADYLYAD